MKRLFLCWAVLTSVLFAFAQIAPAQLPSLGAGKGGFGAGAGGGGGGGWAGVTSGLIAHYANDNTTGATDLVGSLNGTYGSSVTSVAGPSGAAGTAKGLNGDQSYLSFASPPIPDIWSLSWGDTASAFSIVIWIKLNSFGLSWDGGAMRLMSFAGAGFGENYLHFFHNADGTGTAVMELSQNGSQGASWTCANGFASGQQCIFNATFPLFAGTDQWTMFTFTKAPGNGLFTGTLETGEVKYYRDTTELTKTTLSANGLFTANQYFIGSRDVSDRNVSGALGRVLFYNRDITPTEIATNLAAQ